MSEEIPRRLAKTPFLLADLSLITLATVIVYYGDRPISPLQMLAAFLALAVGAWIGMLPYLQEYRAVVRVVEANALSTALDHIAKLEEIQRQLGRAVGDWETVRQSAATTVTAAREIAERMKAEGIEFRAFFDRASESEKSVLRLEVEKLKRAENDWLQVTIRILDHIYALNKAAERSGQTALVAELGQFQHACRDAARRIGINAVVPESGIPVDPAAHNLIDGDAALSPNAKIREVVATGYTFRGQLMRKPLVNLTPELAENQTSGNGTAESESTVSRELESHPAES